MGLEDINADEKEGERIMDKWVKSIFFFFVGLGIGVNIGVEISNLIIRENMRKEMREFKEDYRYLKDLRSYR